jgi:hypothetical protein
LRGQHYTNNTRGLSACLLQGNICSLNTISGKDFTSSNIFIRRSISRWNKNTALSYLDYLSSNVSYTLKFICDLLFCSSCLVYLYKSIYRSSYLNEMKKVKSYFASFIGSSNSLYVIYLILFQRLYRICNDLFDLVLIW